MNSVVSLIISAYNSELWIAESIESALSQTYSPIEVIVVDDGSTDSTLQIASSFQRSGVRVISQNNRGACAARNKGFSVSQGKYIQWLDADDYLEATKVYDQMNVAICNKGAVIYGPWLNRIDTAKRTRFGPRNLTREASNPLAAQLQGLLAPTVAFLTPRDALEAVGGWEESLLADQDGDLFIRLMLRGTRFVHAPGGAGVWRHHQSPHRISSSRSLAAFRSRYQVCCLVIDELRHQNRLKQYARLLAWRLDGLAQLAALDYPDFAEQCLKKAVDACPGYQPQGSLAYKLSRKIFGFSGSERIRLMHRKLKRYLNPNDEDIPKWLTNEQLTEPQKYK